MTKDVHLIVVFASACVRVMVCTFEILIKSCGGVSCACVFMTEEDDCPYLGYTGICLSGT